MHSYPQVSHTVLAFKNASGAWSGELLTEVHNGLDEGEKARVRAEHPGEDEAILGYRVLGCIMVTRGGCSAPIIHAPYL